MIKRQISALTCIASTGLLLVAPQLAEVGYAQQGQGQADRFEGLIDEVEQELAKPAQPGPPMSELEDRGAPANAYAQQYGALEESGSLIKDPNSPLGDPIVPFGVNFSSRKTSHWVEDGAKLLLLEGDVKFWAGAYSFRGESAVVRIETDVQPGRTIHHVAIYLDHATPGGVPGNMGGPIVASARKLLVTVSTYGSVKLDTDLMLPSDFGINNELTEGAMGRFARYDASKQQVLAGGPVRPVFGEAVFAKRAARRSAIGLELSEADKNFVRLANAELERAVVEGPMERNGGSRNASFTGANEPEAAIFPARGTVTYGPVESFSTQMTGENERALMFLGGIDLTYEDYELNRTVSLNAQKAVVFIDERKLQNNDSGIEGGGGELEASGIRGIYLEDNVIVTDGDYSIKAPRVYYDLIENKALVLDAVMYTYDMNFKLPLYVRADALRQTSATSWEADDAQFTTSEFGEPHFAIASSRITIDKRAHEGKSDSYYLSSMHNTAKILGTPLFYFPVVAGEYYDIPLRDVRGGFNSRFGPFIETGWDMFSLFGAEKPEGVDLTGKIGWLGVHNGTLGLDLDYDTETIYGDFKSYLIPLDGGEDVLGEDRNDVNRSGDTRGYETWKHRQYLPENIELSLQSSWVSDDTFLEEFFPREAYEAQQYQASGYVKVSEDNWLVSGVAKTNLNSFTPQLTYLQAPGYTVDKLPEIQATTAPFTLFGETMNWYSQSSISRMRVRAGTDTPGDRGFQNQSSQEVFGFGPNQSFRNFVQNQGIPTDYVLRADTRHELSLPLKVADWVNWTPYVVGRVTAYDRNFEDFGGDSDQVRVWGMVGSRIDTELSKVWTTKRSNILNTNGIRHVFEPYFNFWTVGTTIDDQDLPIFDYDVERIDQGTGLVFGLRNTWQTKRGGPGRWRDVDWIMLDTRYVQRFGEGFPDFQIPRYFNYHPEYSIGGSHFYSELLWMVSDNVALTGQLTWADEHDQVVQWRINGTVNHSPRFQTFVNFEEIPVLSSRLLTYGFSYRMTTKYMVHFLQRFDLSEDNSRRISVMLDRKLPRFVFRVNVVLDVVDNEQLFNVQIIPDGLVGSTNWAATPLRF